MSDETRVTASFKIRNDIRETGIPVLNPGEDPDKVEVLAVACGYDALYYVVEGPSFEVEDILAEHEEYGHIVRIDEVDSEDYGEDLSYQELDGVTYPYGTFRNRRGEIVHTSLKHADVTGQGVWYDSENIHFAQVSQLKYHGVYCGHQLPEGGVLPANLAKWLEEAEKPEDTRTKSERREELRYDIHNSLRDYIRDCYRRAEHFGFSSVKLAAELTTQVWRTHAYRQVGRDYQSRLHGFENGLREEWEKRVLIHYWSFNHEGAPLLEENRLPAEPEGREWTHYCGRFYKAGTQAHFDRGDTPDWLVTRKDGTFWTGEDWGKLSDAKRFYRGYITNKRMAEAVQGQLVHLGELKRFAAERISKRFNNISLSTQIMEKLNKDQRIIWQNVGRIGESRDAEGLATWYVELCDLGEIATILEGS